MSFTRTCRLCAKSNNAFIHIFEDQGLNLDLVIKIHQCLQIEVTTEDVLPTIVCNDCCKKLLNSFEFFCLAKNAQIFLQSLHEVDACFTSAQNETLEKHVESTTSEMKDNKKSSYLTVSKEPNIRTVTVKSNSNGSSETESGMRKYLAATYPWHCTDCSIVLTNLQELKHHHQTVHQQPVRFLCLHCCKIYNVYRKFTRHVRLHRNQGKFRCEECLKGFSTSQALNNHKILHSNARPFICRECGRSFRQASTLHCHQRIHAPGHGTFACPQCKKRLSSQESLQSHLLSHSGSKKFMCEVCGKGFTRKQTLHHHALTHSEGQTVSCQKCFKMFKTQQQLQSHLRVHSHKKFQCDVCGRQFSLLTTLTMHSRIHTGEKPFTCEFCGQCFRFRGVYVVHRRRHTGECPYVCHVCGRAFTNYANHAKHIKRHCQGMQEELPKSFMESSETLKVPTCVIGMMAEKDSWPHTSSSIAVTSILAANHFTAMTFSPIVPHINENNILIASCSDPSVIS